jgi:hypothetical protein
MRAKNESRAIPAKFDIFDTGFTRCLDLALITFSAL